MQNMAQYLEIAAKKGSWVKSLPPVSSVKWSKDIILPNPPLLQYLILWQTLLVRLSQSSERSFWRASCLGKEKPLKVSLLTPSNDICI